MAYELIPVAKNPPKISLYYMKQPTINQGFEQCSCVAVTSAAGQKKRRKRIIANISSWGAKVNHG